MQLTWRLSSYASTSLYAPFTYIHASQMLPIACQSVCKVLGPTVWHDSGCSYMEVLLIPIRLYSMRINFSFLAIVFSC